MFKICIFLISDRNLHVDSKNFLRFLQSIDKMSQIAPTLLKSWGILVNRPEVLIRNLAMFSLIEQGRLPSLIYCSSGVAMTFFGGGNHLAGP